MKSSWRRAYRDSKSWLLDHIVAWFLAFILPGGGTVLATWLIPSGISLGLSALYGFLGGLAGLCVLLIVTYVYNLIRAPYRQRDEARKKVEELQNTNIPSISVKTMVGKREADYERTEHLMWAELQITNNSAGELDGVEVNIAKCLTLQKKQDSPNQNEFVMWNHLKLNPFCVYWSERQAQQKQMDIIIPSGAARVALIAFQDNSNGGQFIFNSLNHEWVVGGVRISVEISSHEAVLWRGDFYIECHPNYAGKTILECEPARFEFVEWDTWSRDKKITLLDFDG